MDNQKNILEKIRLFKNKFESTEESEMEEEMSILDRLNEIIQDILQDNSLTIYTLLSPKTIEKWQGSRFKRWIKNLIFNNAKNFLYLLLLITITGFLVSEALAFYAIDSVISTSTYVKAILTEVCFIFLGGYRASGTLETVWVSSLRVSIFCLMLFVISSETLLEGTKFVTNTNAIAEQIRLVEDQIAEKEKSIIYYRDVKKWPITTKQLIQEKNKLVEKLIELREKQAAGSNEEVSILVRYKSYGKAFFRVLLLFVSVLITRRIFKF